MDHDDLDFDDPMANAPLAPVDLPPFAVPEPAPRWTPAAPRWSPPAAASPAYGLVGVPNQVLRVRDVKTFAVGAAVAALVATVFSWWRDRV